MVMGMRLTQVTLSQEGLLLFLMGSSLLHLNPGWQYITTLLLMMGSMRGVIELASQRQEDCLWPHHLMWHGVFLQTSVQSIK
jgi:hypothetical protein